MQKVGLFFNSGALVCLFIGGLIFSLLFPATLSPKQIMISNITVNESNMLIQGSLAESAREYKDYRAIMRDGKLMIQIRGSVLPIGSPEGDFTIKLENSLYRNARGIYLDDGTQSREIWSR